MRSYKDVWKEYDYIPLSKFLFFLPINTHLNRWSVPLQLSHSHRSQWRPQVFIACQAFCQHFTRDATRNVIGTNRALEISSKHMTSLSQSLPSYIRYLKKLEMTYQRFMVRQGFGFCTKSSTRLFIIGAHLMSLCDLYQTISIARQVSNGVDVTIGFASSHLRHIRTLFRYPLSP